jgi:hypothetical protein
MSEDFVVGRITFDKNLFTEIEDLSKKSIEYERDKKILKAIKELDEYDNFILEKFGSIRCGQSEEMRYQVSSRIGSAKTRCSHAKNLESIKL